MTDTTAPTHWGNDQMGAPTTHKGDRANCPAPECLDAEIAAAEERAPITLPTIPGNRYILDWPGDYCCGDSYCGHNGEGYVPDDILTVTCADCRPGGVEGDPVHVGDIEQGGNLAELLHMIATHENEAKAWHDEAAAATTRKG